MLDRLLDDDPKPDCQPGDQPTDVREPPKSRGQVLKELKQSVARDLENLLNTRWRASGWPEDLGELDLSLVSYGIPDVTGTDLGTLRRGGQFVRVIEEVIGRFEPRFRAVKVEVLDNTEPLDRTLRFRIDAMLEVEPAPEPVSFDSVVQTTTGNVRVIRGTR